MKKLFALDFDGKGRNSKNTHQIFPKKNRIFFEKSSRQGPNNLTGPFFQVDFNYRFRWQEMYRTLLARCEYRGTGLFLIIEDVENVVLTPCRARCGTFLAVELA